MEWFKLSKQRAVVPPIVPEVSAEPDTQSLAAQLAAMPTAKSPFFPNPKIPNAKVPSPKISSPNISSPKARFDNPTVPEEAGEPRPFVRPAQRTKPAFRISSSKDGQTGEFEMTSPTLTVAKARMLFKSGWRVHVTNAAGRQFAPSEFDDILKFD
jgi:hypothetical protein